jgi:hypothetical protein
VLYKRTCWWDVRLVPGSVATSDSERVGNKGSRGLNSSGSAIGLRSELVVDVGGLEFPLEGLYLNFDISLLANSKKETRSRHSLEKEKLFHFLNFNHRLHMVFLFLRRIVLK